MSDENASAQCGSPMGFGGWLIIPMIGTFGAPLLLIKSVADMLDVARSTGWERLSTAGKASIWFEMILTVGITAAWLFAIYAMIEKKSAYPKLFTNLLFAHLCLIGLDALVGIVIFNLPLGESLNGTEGGFIYCIVWMAYMTKSERVKNTFIN